jgi:hypothetical protein
MKRLKYRSIKSLVSDLHITEDQAKAIKQVRGGIPYKTWQDNYPKTYAWYRSCFHTPPVGDIKMEIFNEILNLHGVEGFTLASGETVDYVNTGESYACTIVLMNGNFYVCDWGTIAERDLA